MESTSKTKDSSFAAPSYVDLEPHCDWHKEEGVETLIVHLPSFKKDQLRVRVTTRGVLKISGEKNDHGTRISRVLKETKVPQGCNIHDIRAKFKNGYLHVIMPRKVPNAAQVRHQKDHSASVKSDGTDHQKLQGGNTVCDQTKYQMFGMIRSCLRRMQGGKKMAVTVSLGLVTVVIVAFGAYLGLVTVVIVAFGAYLVYN